MGDQGWKASHLCLSCRGKASLGCEENNADPFYCLSGGGCSETALAYVWIDHLNTPRELTRINASNQHVSIWKWDSLPFGETAPNENPSTLGVMTFNHRFPGQYKDQETGLHQNWHREYDSKLGRYVESDPIGIDGGINTFLYAMGSPILKVDRTGLIPFPAIIALCIADVPCAAAFGALIVGTAAVTLDTIRRILNFLVTESASGTSGEGERKRCIKVAADCRAKCSGLFPTDRCSQGFPFFNCVNDCLKDAGCM